LAVDQRFSKGHAVSSDAEVTVPPLFFVIGPLRTGTSLLARCLDDHPRAICLCESEINRALFTDYYVELHCMRMAAHGLTLDESIARLDRKKQEDLGGWKRWFGEVAPRLSEIYGKPDFAILGDKSPDFFRSPSLVRHLAENYPLIYTSRDPRAIFKSIEFQEDASPEDKAERWGGLIQNYRAWKPYLDSSNVHVVRYEDLVTSPVRTMHRVYEFLGLAPSLRFLEWFRRPFPERFLWSTAVDLESGMRKEFDASRLDSWRNALSEAQVQHVRESPEAVEFMRRFGYES
jgi:hypothetical protein